MTAAMYAKNSVVLNDAFVSVLRRRSAVTSRWVDVEPAGAVCVDIMRHE